MKLCSCLTHYSTALLHPFLVSSVSRSDTSTCPGMKSQQKPASPRKDLTWHFVFRLGTSCTFFIISGLASICPEPRNVTSLKATSHLTGFKVRPSLAVHSNTSFNVAKCLLHVSDTTMVHGRYNGVPQESLPTLSSSVQ